MSSTNLIDLVEQLEENVPAKDGVPSAAQYAQAVPDEAADFSRRCGRVKIATLSVVSGTASYALASDFVQLVKLYSLSNADGIINSGTGLIPVNVSWTEKYQVADGTITFYPTPEYTLSRDYEYKAGWVLDSSDVYQEMGSFEAGIVLLLAEARALGLQANVAAQQAWSYQIGDERVSKEKLADVLRAQAEARKADYMDAVRQYGGRGRTIGRRSLYNGTEYS